ncbi:MAG: aminodeoxychorismate/anthranilate synthase component II [Myxococcales bacterium]|nr:aminodeoxychorismate/anthranilate synthase component II [Myxococcales bacterium]
MSISEGQPTGSRLSVVPTPELAPSNGGWTSTVLLIDNDDSFTGSLTGYCRELGHVVRVVRAREATPADWVRAGRIVLSPGPGRPEEHPTNALALCSGRPVFGVCLGMQALALVFGGQVVPAKTIVHGRTSAIHHLGEGCFQDLPSPFNGTRYHSLAVRRATLPGCLQVTAWTADGEIMGIRHRDLPLEGVQFHPESVRSEHGRELLRNALQSVPAGR